MALLDRSEWYDIARDTNWTPSFVEESELFPDEMSDPYNVPVEAWETFDEPYKISYRQYVSLQREKDAAAYSVKAALSRQRFYESADVGYVNLIKMHYAAIALSEYAACHSDARMTRFGRAPGHAEYGHLRHVGRNAPWPDPAMVPSRTRGQRSAVRLGP